MIFQRHNILKLLSSGVLIVFYQIFIRSSPQTTIFILYLNQILDFEQIDQCIDFTMMCVFFICVCT